MPRLSTRAKPASARPPVSKQTTISSFGRSTKPGIQTQAVERKLVDDLPASKLLHIAKPSIPSPTAYRAKRKYSDTQDEPSLLGSASGHDDHKRVKLAANATANEHAPQYDTTSVDTPQKKRANPQSLPTPESTPTKPRSPAPSSPITPPIEIPSRLSSTSRQRRGQLLLTDLKGLARSAQVKLPSVIPGSKPAPSRTNLQNRSTNLLARLESKQAILASLPPRPSKAEMVRRAALQRVPDVVRVLAQPPSASDEGSQRKSWSKESLVLRIQQSARSVLGEREIEDCLRVIEEEGKALGCEGFLRFKSFGVDKEAVIVDSRCRPLEVELRVKEIQASSIRYEGLSTGGRSAVNIACGASNHDSL